MRDEDDRKIFSSSDSTIDSMRMRNRHTVEPLAKILFLAVWFVVWITIAVPAFWIGALLGFAPEQGGGSYIIIGSGVIATVLAFVFTGRIELLLRRWFFL